MSKKIKHIGTCKNAIDAQVAACLGYLKHEPRRRSAALRTVVPIGQRQAAAT